MLLLSTIVIIAFHSSKISETINNSVSLCYKTIIPALYPMLIISSLLSAVGLPTTLKRILHKVTYKTFGLSGNCSEAIITGLLCGYNSAYISAADLYKNKRISLAEAQRTALFFTSPGISFCVIITGITYYNSSVLGILFLLSNILSSVICAFIYNNCFNFVPAKTIYKNNTSLSDALINSVTSTTNTLISISSWIVLSNCLITICGMYTKGNTIQIILNIFAEVSSGIIYCKNNSDIFLTSVCLSFGGLCIFLQQLPLMKLLKIKPLKALLYKLATTTVASVLFNILISLVHVNTDVFNMYNTKISLYNSPVGSFALVILLIAYIYSSLNNINSISSQRNKK